MVLPQVREVSVLNYTKVHRYLRPPSAGGHPKGFEKLAGLNFSISQHIKDEPLMRSLVSYFGCGRYTARSNKPLGEYECTKLSDINEKIIPFFIKHPIVGIKSLDFTD